MPRKKTAETKTKTATSKPKKAETEEKTVSKKASISEKIHNNRIKIIVLTIFVALAILAYVYRDLFVAATVNGEPITRWSVVTTAEESAGPQVLDNLISQKIIEQEAKERGITATNEDLEEAYQELSQDLETQGVSIENLMNENNVSREEVYENLRPQVLQEKLIESEGIAITDEEVDSFLQENEDLLPDEPQEQEATRENIRQSLRNQKVQEYMQRLRAEANVNYFVEY